MIVDVVMHPSEIALLKGRVLNGVCCVVFDVLRATSSILTGLAHGVAEVVPVETIEEARGAALARAGAILGGERNGDRIEGFDLGNSPLEYRSVAGAVVVTTTTNGTVALRACTGADTVWVGAVLNLGALAREIRRAAPEKLMLVCAGTFETMALEDVWAAGALLEAFADAQWTDSARCAAAVASQWPDPAQALRFSRNGRALLEAGRGADLDWCASLNKLDVVGEMLGGVIRARRSA
jgi:2-phosphosulfolactate phosphatase